GVDCGLVDTAGRDDLTAEDAHAETLEPAERPEALTLALGGLDRGAPVDVDDDSARLHAPVPSGRREDDWNARQLPGALLEQRPGLTWRQPGDVDTGDLRTGRQALGRAGECEAEGDRHDHDDDRDEQAPLPEEPDASTATPAVAGRVCYPNRQVDQCIGSA